MSCPPTNNTPSRSGAQRRDTRYPHPQRNSPPHPRLSEHPPKPMTKKAIPRVSRTSSQQEKKSSSIAHVSRAPHRPTPCGPARGVKPPNGGNTSPNGTEETLHGGMTHLAAVSFLGKRKKEKLGPTSVDGNSKEPVRGLYECLSASASVRGQRVRGFSFGTRARRRYTRIPEP